MTIDLHAADPCSRCHKKTPRITITEGAATISCSNCQHASRTYPDSKRAVEAWNAEWRSVPMRAKRLWLATVCFFAEHRFGKTQRITSAGVWCNCLRCHRDIRLPHPLNYRGRRARRRSVVSHYPNFGGWG